MGIARVGWTPGDLVGLRGGGVGRAAVRYWSQLAKFGVFGRGRLRRWHDGVEDGLLARLLRLGEEGL